MPFVVFVSTDSLQVHVNGSVTFGESVCVNHSPQFFPAADVMVVAPYWDDISLLSPNARLGYVVTDDTSNPLMEQVKVFLSDKRGRKFDPLMILVAQWISVCPDTDRNCGLEEVLDCNEVV